MNRPRFKLWRRSREGKLGVTWVGGNYSALTTTVRINTTLSSAVAGVNYEFQDAVVSWPHLDSTPKSIAITFPDNNIFEANPSLTLHLVPSVQIGGQILLRIADNGDGGRLGFSSQRITRPETAPQSASCLVNVRQDWHRVTSYGAVRVLCSRVGYHEIGFL